MSPLTTIRSRASQLEALGNHVFDVLVLGGGISGAATAHVLVARGYRVALIDAHDFASGTSQESSQLVWGGIKYLEQGHVRLVNELCLARNELVKQYPDRVTPQRFLYPHFNHDPHMRLSILAGSTAYWMMGGCFGLPPALVSRRSISRKAPKMQLDGVNGGIEYTDARMVRSDARLVLDLLFDAVDCGLSAANYVSLEGVRRTHHLGAFEVDAFDRIAGAPVSINANWIVNTTGAWVDEVNEILGVTPPHEILFSKGIHLLVPRIETGERTLACRGEDGRIFFVIPWGNTTLVGTTDTPLGGPPRRVRADAEDIDYLRTELDRKFAITLDDRDILNTKAGLRPLLKPTNGGDHDFLELARGHKVWADSKARVSALWGGKFTDAFTMAREVAATVEIAPSLEMGDLSKIDPVPYPSEKDYSDAEAPWNGLADSCNREMVARIEDLLRRRTNIGLKVANHAWGFDLEHEPQIRRIAEVLAANNGQSPDVLMEDYRKSTVGKAAETEPASEPESELARR